MGCIGDNCQVIEFSVAVKTVIYTKACDDQPPPKDERIAAAIAHQLEQEAAPSGCEDGCHCVKARGATPVVTVEDQEYEVDVRGHGDCVWTCAGTCTVTTSNTPGLCSKNRPAKKK